MLSAFRHRWLGTDPADYERMTDEMRAYLALIDAPLLAVAHGRVLELGCGTGRFLEKLAGTQSVERAVGVDIAPQMLERAHARGHSVVLGSAMELPFSDASFDVIVCPFYTMRDLDRPQVYAEAARVLPPGGMLAFTLRSFVPVYVETLWRNFLRRRRLPRSWRTLDGADGVENNLLRPSEELDALAQAGFQPREVSGLKLLPFVRRFVPPGYWHGRAAAFGSDVIFVMERV